MKPGRFDQVTTGRAAIAFMGGRPVRLPDHRDGWPPARHPGTVAACPSSATVKTHHRRMLAREHWVRVPECSGPGEPDADRGSRTASASPPGRRATVARGALADAERRIDARIAERIPPGLRDGLFTRSLPHRVTRLRRQGERYFADGLLPGHRVPGSRTGRRRFHAVECKLVEDGAVFVAPRTTEANRPAPPSLRTRGAADPRRRRQRREPWRCSRWGRTPALRPR